MACLVAVDCHRKSLFVVAADTQGKELWHRSFPTTLVGETELMARLRPGDRVVLEATAGTYRLASRLESTGAVVLLADPQQARLVGMRGKKTDYRDCRALLTHLRAGTLVEVWRPDPTTRQIRQLTRERHAYNQSIVRLKNRIQALLWEEGLAAPSNLWTASGRQWLAEQALATGARRILERELRGLEALTLLKQSQEEELAAWALELPQAHRLMQIPGFGPVCAVMFLGEVGDLARFPSAKQLASYAGLDPRVHQSGERCMGGSMSKAGRSQLRWLMIEVAWGHVEANGPEAERYHRMVAQGKAKGVAIAALARYLLTLAYLLLTRQETYHRLPVAKYEAKLTRLAARRPYTEGEQASNVDWAAERLRAVTGKESPYRQAHPRARPGRRLRTDTHRLNRGQSEAPTGGTDHKTT